LAGGGGRASDQAIGGLAGILDGEISGADSCSGGSCATPGVIDHEIADLGLLRRDRAEACRREREHNERNFRERVHGRFLSAILERDDFCLNRHPALAFWWSMIFFRKPVSTPDQVRGRLFRDHALAPFTARANTESSSNRYDKKRRSVEIMPPPGSASITAWTKAGSSP